jgi:hypothetical protein
MRVREGTMLGHIIEHVALELQELAGMPAGFGRTRETATPGIYQVVIEYLMRKRVAMQHGQQCGCARALLTGVIIPNRI